MLMCSIVCFTLGIKDHRVVSTNLVNNELRIELDARKRRKLPCGVCRERRWSHVSLWGITVFLYYRPRRAKCLEHGIKVERIAWNMGKKPISFPFVTVLSFWSRLLPWDQVARHFKVSWNAVGSAVDDAVAYGRQQEDYGGVRLIGIVEISRKEGHVYHTQVYDLERKRLIWTGAHRDKDSLQVL